MRLYQSFELAPIGFYPPLIGRFRQRRRDKVADRLRSKVLLLERDLASARWSAENWHNAYKRALDLLQEINKDGPRS